MMMMMIGASSPEKAEGKNEQKQNKSNNKKLNNFVYWT